MIAFQFTPICRRNPSKMLCCLKERTIHGKTSATKYLFNETRGFYGLCFPMTCEEIIWKFFPRTSLGDSFWISDTIILPFENRNICMTVNKFRRKGTRNVESMITNQGYPLHVTKYKVFQNLWASRGHLLTPMHFFYIVFFGSVSEYSQFF